MTDRPVDPNTEYERVPTTELEAIIAAVCAYAVARFIRKFLPKEAIVASQRFLAEKLLEAHGSDDG